VEDLGTDCASCWIEGRNEPADGRYPLVNPADGSCIGYATTADERLVTLALKSADRSLGVWKSTPAPRRAELMHALADLVRGHLDEFTSLVSTEVGKPVRSAKEEVLSAAGLIDYFAEESLRLTGQIPLLGYHREQVMIVREPVGVVVAITPYNYPLSTLACKIAPALSVGCTVVMKPDEHTPLSTLRLAQLACRAGIPEGVLNAVTGPGRPTGRLLVDNPVPRLITFTGSTEVGKEILMASGRWVRKTILELGGNCPAILCSDAPWEELLPQLLMQSMKNSGQYCYRVSRYYVAEEIYADFLAEFVAKAAVLRVGHPASPGVDLGPLNNAGVLSRVREQVDIAVKEGARVVLGGNDVKINEAGFFYPPTVLTGVDASMSVVGEEIFGPVVMIMPFKRIEEVIEAANATPFGLAAYLFTGDIAEALKWANQLEVGSVWVNRIHQAYSQAPFGGMKESGLGREKSRFGVEEYTELKTIYLSY